ncbi:MAG: hypothetical protein U5O15_04010 [Candidatus Krumholzibacteriota bacterium]|nr:hypothetical protein [Candidatus Krumholzibacteriota bacterium]
MELMFSFYPAIGIVKNAVYFPCEEIAPPALRLALPHFLVEIKNPCPLVFREGFEIPIAGYTKEC